MKANVASVELVERNCCPEPNTGCWLWTAGMRLNGYGQVKIRRVNQLAHRVSYQVHVGPMPEGMCVCHKCDVPCCVNPDHLFLGTQADNMRDRDRKGRCKAPNAGKTHCKRGHAFDAANTYQKPSGGRQCRACERNR